MPGKFIDVVLFISFMVHVLMCFIVLFFLSWVQKFHDEAQKAKMEAERLHNLLLEKQVDAEICKKEIEMQKTEIANLNQKISEVCYLPIIIMQRIMNIIGLFICG